MILNKIGPKIEPWGTPNRGYAQHKGLVALTECQHVGWRLIKVENCDNENYQGHTKPNLILFFMKFTILQVILTLNNHWLDP